MISLKLPVKKSLAEAKMAEVDYPQEPAYPWGTRIDLNEEAMNMLGLDADDFTVEDNIKVVAKCKVCETSKREYTDHEGNIQYDQRIELQITHMELHPIDSKSVRELMRMIRT